MHPSVVIKPFSASTTGVYVPTLVFPIKNNNKQVLSPEPDLLQEAQTSSLCVATVWEKPTKLLGCNIWEDLKLRLMAPVISLRG